MVSVIVPTYNYGSYIADTLRSVADQSYSDLECIIIDDGSTDDTAARVAPFLSDPRFIYIQQVNSGVSKSRNNGLRRAKGDYVLLLDADDLIEKEKLKTAVAFLDAHKAVDLVYSSMRYFRTEDPAQLYFSFNCDKRNDRPWMKNISGQGAELVPVLLEGNIMVISSPVFKRSLLEATGYFDERIVHNEDWDLWLRMALLNKRMQFIDAAESHTLIRIHKTSASNQVFKMQAGGLLVLKKNAPAIESFGLQAALKQRIDGHRKAIAASLIRTNRREFVQRLEYLKRAGIYQDIFSYAVKTLFLAKLYLRIFKAIV